MTEEKRQPETCIVQPAVHRKKKGPVAVIPNQILARRDLALLAIGSAACLRGVYLAIAPFGQLDRYFTCEFEPEEYRNGRWEEKLKRKLEELTAMAGIGGVVIYTSCLERIYDKDFAPVIHEVSEASGVPVEVLWRGALVSPERNPFAYLPEVLKAIPDEGKIFTPGHRELPPLQTDFAGIARLLQPFDTYNFLVDAGGCTECFAVPDEEVDTFHLRKSRFSNLKAARRWKELLVDRLAEDYQKKGEGKLCCLMSSVIPEALAFDFKDILDELQSRHIPAVYIPSNGRKSSAEGIAEGLKVLAGRAGDREVDAVYLWGACSYEGIGAEAKDRMIRELGRNYCPVFCPDEERLDTWKGTRPKMNAAAVTSALPLVIEQEKQGIPYRLCFSGRGEATDQGNVLLIGDPVITAGMAGDRKKSIVRAFYADSRETEAWYRHTLALAEDHCPGISHAVCFRNRTELKQLVEKADVIYGERLFKEVLGDDWKGKQWKDMDESLFSSGIEIVQDNVN
ncbi:hypothetical protein [Dialister sp.]|uniref:hypothetical protein n=1 Tax=Dialister sp. TaxID=1955814 RepID=UPI003F04B0D6